MKFLVVMVLFGMIACQGQTTVKVSENCDTIIIESPTVQKCADDLAEATSTIEQQQGQIANQATQIETLLTSNTDLHAQVNDRDERINNQTKEIKTLEDEVVSLNTSLKECQDAGPVMDTVYVDVPLDYITIGGKDYKVSEIEKILPMQTVDTIDIAFCEEETGERTYLHEGSIVQYPHFVNVASKDRGMVKVWFETPLDSTIKVQDHWKLKRIRNHEQARTEMTFISAWSE